MFRYICYWKWDSCVGISCEKTKQNKTKQKNNPFGPHVVCMQVHTLLVMSLQFGAWSWYFCGLKRVYITSIYQSIFFFLFFCAVFMFYTFKGLILKQVSPMSTILDPNYLQPVFFKKWTNCTLVINSVLKCLSFLMWITPPPFFANLYVDPIFSNQYSNTFSIE